MPIKFIKGAIKDPFKTGAIAPSSKRLAKEMLRYWPKERDAVVVEYGPGSGAITKRIYEKVVKHRYIGFEYNSTFVEQLQKDFSNFEFVAASVEELPETLNRNGIDSVELIVSGLPWAVFKESFQRDVLNLTKEAMSGTAVFSTFAYVHALKMRGARKFSRLIQEVFPNVKTSKVVWNNIPPAIVYHCSKSRLT